MSLCLGNSYSESGLKRLAMESDNASPTGSWLRKIISKISQKTMQIQLHQSLDKTSCVIRHILPYYTNSFTARSKAKNNLTHFMLTYKQLSKKPKSLLSFTGVTRQQFDVILKDVRKNHRIEEKKRLSKAKRKRSIGAGRKFDLSLEDQLVMLFVYYRMYLTCELTGYLFGLDQSNVYRNIRFRAGSKKNSFYSCKTIL